MVSPGGASASLAVRALLRTARSPRASSFYTSSGRFLQNSSEKYNTEPVRIASTSSSFLHSQVSPPIYHKAKSQVRHVTQGANRSSSRQSSPEKKSFSSQNSRLTPNDARSVNDVQSWLGNAFPGLKFPDEIALMMITHESWDFGVSAGHNRRLSFLGRRAMKFYLSLFLAVHDKKGGIMNNERIDDLLMVWKLGDNIGRSLRLEEIMRWTPAISDGQTGPRETGLFKIRGVAVEALLGAIYHQHGAQVAKAFFSSRILPSLEGFSEEEEIELEAGIVSESRAGDEFLLRMAEIEKSKEREEVSEALDTATSRGESSSPSQEIHELNQHQVQSNTQTASSTSSIVRRKSPASSSNSISIEDNRVTNTQTHERSSFA